MQHSMHALWGQVDGIDRFAVTAFFWCRQRSLARGNILLPHMVCFKRKFLLFPFTLSGQHVLERCPVYTSVGWEVIPYRYEGWGGA
jgi:hypothetical protein